MASPRNSRREAYQPEFYNENQKVHLLQLPEDILSHILSYLDARSKVCAWHTCEQLRRALWRYKFVRRLYLQNWRVAHITYDFLRGNALYIEELDLSCAKGLLEASAISALTQLKNLRSLDITHTAVTLRGASAACAACPRLVRLACDAKCDQEDFLVSNVARDSFKNLEYVHFVADPWPSACTYVRPPQTINLGKHLKEFKLSTSKLDSNDQDRFFQFLKCVTGHHPTLKSFSCHFIGVDFTFRRFRLGDDNFFEREWEILIAKNFGNDPYYQSKLYLSRQLYRAAFTLLQLDPNILSSLIVLDDIQYFQIKGKHAIDLYAWCSDLIELNPNLYTDVARELNSKLAYTVCRKTFSSDSSNKCNDSYIVSKCTFKEVNIESNKRQFDLNYAELLPIDRRLKVSHDFHILSHGCEEYIKRKRTRCDIILSLNYPVLRNIVHFSLSDEEFDPLLFDVFFKQCANLETMNIRVRYCSTLKSISLSRSIRNIRVMSEITESEGGLIAVFRALAACRTLENIHIYDMRYFSTDSCSDVQFDPKEEVLDAFFQGCPMLCSLHVYGYIDRESEVNIRKVVNKGNRDLKFTVIDANITNSNEFHAMALYLPSRVFYEHTNLSDLNVNRELNYPKEATESI